MDLFEHYALKDTQGAAPLAERMRPKSLDAFIGQKHVVGDGMILRNAIERDRIFSMIFWGPPGCGKTTLAGVVAAETASYFIHFSAVLSGIKEIRAVIEEAKKQKNFYRRQTLLFVDEIHRFNKAQQDAFLHHVESGLITLIGATTENPSFEVIPPLLSRCRVITLERLSSEELTLIIKNTLQNPSSGLGRLRLDMDPEVIAHLVRIADGDARVVINALEAATALFAKEHGKRSKTKTQKLTLDDIEQSLQVKALHYDKSGEEHFNLISAFHKSLRGSDPDAALYWLGRMLMAGEDPLYIVRRMVRFASEDVGNADPQALTIAMSAKEAFRFLGKPEGELALAQAAVYLATAPKSNRIYAAFGNVTKTIKKSGSLPVPLHVRNAPTSLMEELGYGKDYKYAHEHKNGYVFQEYLPPELKGQRYYFPTERGYEKIIKQRLEKWFGMKKNKPSMDTGSKK